MKKNKFANKNKLQIRTIKLYYYYWINCLNSKYIIKCKFFEFRAKTHNCCKIISYLIFIIFTYHQYMVTLEQFHLVNEHYCFWMAKLRLLLIITFDVINGYFVDVNFGFLVWSFMKVDYEFTVAILFQTRISSKTKWCCVCARRSTKITKVQLK